jgi:ABC-type uncharacterized transport system permease subunit
MWMSVLALSSIVPAVAQAFRERSSRDPIFWTTLALGIAGPLCWIFLQSGAVWQTGLAATLWVTIASTMTLYAVVSVIFRHAWRLGPLVAGYMLLLGIGATIWQNAMGDPLHAAADERAWVNVHIAMAVVTYGLVTLAAVAACGAVLQERFLKRKQPSSLSRHLPSIADCDGLQVTLLQYGETILALGLATGMALQYLESGELLLFNHKTVLTLAAFAVIGGLLVAHRWMGVRGRRAARLVLLGYLLLTLGYPGVKFVTEVLIG